MNPLTRILIMLAISLISSLLHSPAVHAELRPAVTTEQASLAFITLRQATNAPRSAKTYFGAERGVLRQGFVDLESQSISLLQNLRSKVPFYLPEGQTRLSAINEQSAPAFEQALSRYLQGQRPVFYLHGYNTDFAKAARRSHRIQMNLQLTQRLILVSWPSDGIAANYTRDEADMLWSVHYLEQLFSDMIERHKKTGIDIMAHSLGNRGLILALEAIAKRTPQPLSSVKSTQSTQPIRHLVLIAADMDAAMAIQRMPTLQRIAQRISIYVSANDQALLASEALHGYPRLGQAGKHLYPLSPLKNVEIIDLSELPVERLSGHLYHLSNRAMIQDLYQLIQQDKKAHERQDLVSTTHEVDNYWMLSAKKKQ